MPNPAPCSHEDALHRALAAHREALLAKVAEIDAKRDAGRITIAQHRDQVHAAHAAYDRDCALAEIEADTGWHCWVGVGGVLYARREKTSPPQVVRAPSPQALREAIEASNGGAR